MEEFYLLWKLSRRPEISQTITDLAILNQLVMSDGQQTVVAKIWNAKIRGPIRTMKTIVIETREYIFRQSGPANMLDG